MKTKSELMKELQMSCDVINEYAHGELKVTDGHTDNIIVSHYNNVGDFTGCITGQIPYAPDPDTREQALEKAQKLQREKEADPDVKWCDCERNANGSMYIVTWWCDKDDTDRTTVFKFAETDDQ